MTAWRRPSSSWSPCSATQSLDFDLELAKSKTNENPVFYVQYAHARVASVMKELTSRSIDYDPAQAREVVLSRGAELLAGAQAEAMLSCLSRYPEVIRRAAAQRAPHALVHYLRELATTLHAFYNAERILVTDADPRSARLYALLAVQQVVRNGLGVLGATAPAAEAVETGVGGHAVQEGGQAAVVEALVVAQELDEGVLHGVQRRLLVVEQATAAPQDHRPMAAVQGLDVEGHARPPQALQHRGRPRVSPIRRGARAAPGAIAA